MDFVQSLKKRSNVSVDEIEMSVPDIQRQIDPELVEPIYQNHNEYYLSHGEYCILGTITIAVENDIEYLIDGQHRMTAYKRLRQDYPERCLTVNVDVLYLIKHPSAIERVYQLVNTCRPNEINRLSVDHYKILNDFE